MLETKTVGLVEIPLQQEVAKDLIQRSKAKFCYYQSQDGAQCIIHVVAQSVKCPSHLSSPAEVLTAKWYTTYINTDTISAPNITLFTTHVTTVIPGL